MKILIVEDDAFISFILQDNLEAMGHEVIGPADSVAAALPLVSSCEAAILDVNLGKEETSFPVADELMAANIPFIFASGYRDTYEGYAPVDYLLKPYGPANLEEALSKIP